MQKNLNCSKACLCLDDGLDTKCSPNDSIECECNSFSNNNDLNNIEKTDKCKNYILCSNIESQDILDSHDGLCIYCFIMNGKLKINENTTNQKCTFCLEINKNIVEFPNKCEHHICTDCYKTKSIFEFTEKCDEKNNIFNTCSICPG